jgi:hypothetical protein
MIIFLCNIALFRVENANFFTNFIGESVQKIPWSFRAATAPLPLFLNSILFFLRIGLETNPRSSVLCAEASTTVPHGLKFQLSQTSIVVKLLDIPAFLPSIEPVITIAQSFSPFLAQDGRQVCCPSWIWVTSLSYILLNKFVTLVGSGRQTCRPSLDKKGLKDWANVIK